MQPGRQALIDRRPPAMRALVDAAKQGNARRVSELLDDPSAAPYVTWAAYAAAATGGVAVTKVIAEKCGDATLHDREHLALRLSARRGDLDMFKMLLDTGSLLAAKDRQALRLAALHRHDAIISEGWRRGFPLWTIEELVAAARADRVDRVRWILSDPRFTEQSWRVAFAAVDAGAVGVIRMLAATRPSALHDRNHLALRMAARAGRLDVFQALLGSGSEPAARGGQALALARLHGHRRIARICENRGAGGFAPATVRDLLDAACSGDTARVDELIDDPIFEQHASRVGIAAAAGGAVEVVELLIRRLSAQVLHHRDHLALRIAARRGDLAIVDVLLAN
ncbi:MAG TPA: hypothetical protein PK264_16455, partial [Hyphomicrobiaceae bacterium]|nr:hypothetical protein [Hyphomicrobiaceae bacterium]